MRHTEGTGGHFFSVISVFSVVDGIFTIHDSCRRHIAIDIENR